MLDDLPAQHLASGRRSMKNIRSPPPLAQNFGQKL
jgi:hypothetical protein